MFENDEILVAEEEIEAEAGDDRQTFAGKKGAVLSWQLDEEGILTIEGSGAMQNYYGEDPDVPWKDCKDQIYSLIVETGVTEIGVQAFTNCVNLKDIAVPRSLCHIHYAAFDGCSALEEVFLPPHAEIKHIYDLNEKDEKDLKKFKEQKSHKPGSGGRQIIVIGRRAFRGTPWSDQTGGDFMILGDRLIEYLGSQREVVVPAKIHELGTFAFEGCDMDSLVLPEGLRRIGMFAFEGIRVPELRIPDGVDGIEQGAFAKIGAGTEVFMEKVSAPLEDNMFENSQAVFHKPEVKEEAPVKKVTRRRTVKKKIEE